MPFTCFPRTCFRVVLRIILRATFRGMVPRAAHRGTEGGLSRARELVFLLCYMSPRFASVERSPEGVSARNCGGYDGRVKDAPGEVSCTPLGTWVLFQKSWQ